MNSLADYINPNIGNYMKYDTAAGGKASLVDFLKIYFSDEKTGGEERIGEDKEIRASRKAEDDNIIIISVNLTTVLIEVKTEGLLIL